MEAVMEAVNNLNIGADSHNKNRIQVSNTKKPLFFYVNLAKRYMQQHNEVELSALGMVMGMVFEGVIGLVEIGVVSKSSIQNPLQVDVKGIKLQNFVMQPNTSIATAVTIAEILKNNGLAVEKKIMTSTVDMKDQSTGRPIQKAKIEILLRKAENFDELMAAATEEREAAESQGHS